MLLGSILNFSLAFRGECVVRLKVESHAGKALGCERLAVLPIAIAGIARQFIRGRHLGAIFLDQLRRERAFAAEHEDVFPVREVVDRNVPVNRIALADHAAANTVNCGSAMALRFGITKFVTRR